MGIGHGHNHHNHEHRSVRERESGQKKLFIVLCLVVVFLVVEFIGGLVSGSLALVADSGHMLSDAAALALALFAIRIARRPATAKHTYGFYRTEILAALFNGATLIAIAILVMIEAAERLNSPEDVQAPLMMGIAAAGLAVNLASLAILHGGHSSSLNVRGAYLHVLGDALGSIGALAAGAAIWMFGWRWADPAVSVVVAVLILVSSWTLVRQSVGVLMEGTPGGIDVDEVRHAIASVPGITAVHDLHVWSITSGMDSLSVHAVCSDEHVDVAQWSGILKAVRDLLREQFGITHATIQLEPAAFSTEASEECADCHSST